MGFLPHCRCLLQAELRWAPGGNTSPHTLWKEPQGPWLRDGPSSGQASLCPELQQIDFKERRGEGYHCRYLAGVWLARDTVSGPQPRAQLPSGILVFWFSILGFLPRSRDQLNQKLHGWGLAIEVWALWPWQFVAKKKMKRLKNSKHRQQGKTQSLLWKEERSCAGSFS